MFLIPCLAKREGEYPTIHIHCQLQCLPIEQQRKNIKQLVFSYVRNYLGLYELSFICDVFFII